MNYANIIGSLKATLPPVFSREEAARQLGGLICAKTLSNLDALGKGPSVKLRVGKKVAYERDNFLKWLNSQISEPQSSR